LTLAGILYIISINKFNKENIVKNNDQEEYPVKLPSEMEDHRLKVFLAKLKKVAWEFCGRISTV
jgi:hypothetical protein